MTEELHVEIGFDAKVNDPFPKWYDVSPYVISGKGKRGRSYEIDDIETGTRAYELDNPGGLFTPGRKTLTLLSERFNAVSVAGNPGVFAADTGVWEYGGSSAFGNTVTPSSSGLVHTATVSEGGWSQVALGAANKAVPVKLGDVINVTYKVKATSVAPQVTIRSSLIFATPTNTEESSALGTSVVSASGGWVTRTDTFTVTSGTATYVRPSVRAYPQPGMGSLTLTVTVASVKVTVPSPYAGKVEPAKPIREYVIADDNWIHYQSVSPKFLDAEGPRFTPKPSFIVAPTPTVQMDATLGREVWEFQSVPGSSKDWFAGYEGDFEHIPVKAGQLVTGSGLIANMDPGETPFAWLSIGFSTTGALDSFTDMALGQVFGLGVYTPVSFTWTATSDGYVRLAVHANSSTSEGKARATDLKLTLDGKGTSTVAALSGRIPIFRGQIERWSQEYHGKLSTVSVECVDGLASLSAPIKTQYRGAVDAWYRKNVRGTPADDKFFYWPCVEKEDRASTDPSVGLHKLNVYPGALPGNSTRGFTTTKTMVYSDGMESGGWTVHVDQGSPWFAAAAALSLTSGFNPALPEWATSLDVDFWFLPEALPVDGYMLWDAVTDYNNAGASNIEVHSSGSVGFRYGLTNVVGGGFSSPSDVVVPGVPIHIGMRVSINTAAKTATTIGYVNGVSVGSSTDSVSFQPRPEIPRFERVTVGQNVGAYGAGTRFFERPMSGTINHVVMAWNAPGGFHADGSPWAFHLDIHPSGSDLPDSETVRLDRILDMAGWTGPRRFDPDLSTLLPSRWNQDDDGGAVLKETAESAGGVVYVGPSGAAVYQNRHRRVSPPVRWTVYEWADGLRFQLDDSRVRNEVKAERVTGLVRIARDDTSIDKYGRKPLAVKRDVVDANEVADAASWLLRRYRVAAPWCDTLRVDAHTLTGSGDATLKALAYGADMSQRLLMTDLPPDAPADECDFFIEGVETEFVIAGGVLKWTATLSVSDVGNSMAWTLEDTTSGILESDACVLNY